MTRMSASEAFVETLAAQGVTHVFGIVGSAYMDALDLFPAAGIRFIPTGGINLANLEGYLYFKSLAAVGGTWIARPEDLAGGKWHAIRDRCKAALEIVHKVRGPAA